MLLFIGVLICLIYAWGCSYFAKRRGRDPKFWFYAGALFGLAALIILFILDRKAPKTQTAPEPLPQKDPVLTLVAPTHAEKYWYFLDTDKAQHGPMSLNALSRAWHEGKVSETTFVWNEEMENWQHFKEVIQPPQKAALN